MTDKLSSMLAMHVEVVNVLDKQLDAIRFREEAAQAEIDRCRIERQRVEEEKFILSVAEQLYQRVLGQSEASAKLTVGESVGDVQKPPRARIGPKRYLILDAISKLGEATNDQVAEATHLHARRVRDQMATDARRGLVIVSLGEVYSLTDLGVDLLDRYRTYRKTAGLPLPSVDDPDTDDEVEADDSSDPSHVTGNPLYDPGDLYDPDLARDHQLHNLLQGD